MVSPGRQQRSAKVQNDFEISTLFEKYVMG